MQLSRLTGFSKLTCRKGLKVLLAEGVLVPGPSPHARPRVAVPGGAPAGDGEAALSRALADRRRAAGLTQPRLATQIGCSVTSVGHAETGRVWQSRAFWEKADAVLDADGELTRLHDAYLAGAAALAPAAEPEPGPAALTLVTLHWSDGTQTAVCPPAVSAP